MKLSEPVRNLALGMVCVVFFVAITCVSTVFMDYNAAEFKKAVEERALEMQREAKPLSDLIALDAIKTKVDDIAFELARGDNITALTCTVRLQGFLNGEPEEEIPCTHY